MKAIQTSIDLFEKQTNLEKGPRVAFMEVIAELKDPGKWKLLNEESSFVVFIVSINVFTIIFQISTSLRPWTRTMMMVYTIPSER